jgi:transposase, IS30 family
MSEDYHHLTNYQRCQLYTLKKRGDSASTIAKELDVHRSTIYRELFRNSGKRGYQYKQASEKSESRRQAASQQRSKMTPETISLIEEKLVMRQWSPEQISGWMKKEGHANAVSHETIYQHIWKDRREEGLLYKQLRHRGKKYNRRGKNIAGRGCIPKRVDIDERPAIVETKERLGDWELDTIIGTGQSGVIVSMVERTSKLTKLVLLPRRTADEVSRALIDSLDPIKEFVHTLTADNGKEFAGHVTVAESLEAGFYFAKPYHSWERGLNEHTNGLVRQYFPKTMRFDEITDEMLMGVEILLNNRPRKILDFSTPVEIFENFTEVCIAATS